MMAQTKWYLEQDPDKLSQHKVMKQNSNQQASGITVLLIMSENWCRTCIRTQVCRQQVKTLPTVKDKITTANNACSGHIDIFYAAHQLTSVIKTQKKV